MAEPNPLIVSQLSPDPIGDVLADCYAYLLAKRRARLSKAGPPVATDGLVRLEIEPGTNEASKMDYCE